MSSQTDLTYTENFADIANWADNFASGTGASAFGSVAVNSSGTIPDGVKTTVSSATFTTGTSGGVQKGTGNIVLLTTGSTDNNASVAIDFFMDFTNVNANKLSFDWATVFNSTGNRCSSLRVYYSTDGTAFTEITGAQVLNKANNVAASGSITNVSLPSAFNNCSTARLRFYEYNGTGGSSGSRAKISIDNLVVTATTPEVNTITIGTLTTPPFYVDSSTQATGSVAFTSTGTFSDATFTAKLSDASGSFTSPTNIGTETANGTNPSGNISITIPMGTAEGTGYKIRIDCASPAVTGSASAAFTIQNGAKNVTGVSTSVASKAITVNWTNPTRFFDEIMIVAKAGSSISSTPTGNGGSYTANLLYGIGTSFDGGYVVYKGTESPQTITNLTNGTTYYIKLFTRKNTNWSSGVEVNNTPAQTRSLVHYWNFNTGAPTEPNSWPSSIDATQGSGVITYNLSSPTSYAGSTLNGVVGETGGGSFSPIASTDLVNNNKYFQMAITSAGYRDIVLSYATRGTGAGFSSQIVYYSLDGNNFTEKETITGTNVTSYSVKTIDFSSITGVNNNPNFKVRIVVTGATDPNGNNRFDNIQITGNAIEYDYPNETQVVANGILVTVTGGSANNGTGSMPTIPNTSGTYTNFIFALDNSITNWTITMLTNANLGAYYQNGNWHVVYGNGTQVVFSITLSGKAEVEIPVILGDQDPTLPVELSSFMATLTAQNTVSVMWVTQSETNVNGYYVYRGMSSELEEAATVSPLIPATNTSQQQMYQFTDSEAFEPGTYYYWLQVQDLDGSIQFHGPTTVYFDNGGNPGTPDIPKLTELKSVYPNPFNPNTTISYSLAKAATVDFVIYNNRGQIVRSINVGEKNMGSYQLLWNGTDNNGRECGTGVYFIKMSAGKDSFIRKAVLMK